MPDLFFVPFDLEIHIQYPFRAERLKPFGMKILADGDGVQAVIAQLSVSADGLFVPCGGFYIE